MAAAEIQVYASFPRTVALDADLSLDPSNWRWVHCLTLPLATLNALQFSCRPYKWIRYATGIVVGAEGDLSSSPDSLSIVDYNAGLPAGSTVLYYHTSDEEKRRMFPVDPEIGRTNLTSSSVTARRAQFYDEVAERDGKTCTLTSLDEQLCKPAHLLAHSKGDTYIATYTQRRSRDTTGGDIVQDIDSVRNGVFLNAFTHGVLRKYVAFLMTPNFAMNTDDIDPSAPPAARRCTAHLFQPDAPYSFAVSGLPSGSPLRMADTPQWPPDILFDAVYASAVLRYFGTQTLKDEVSATWKTSFQPGGVVTTAHVDTAQDREREARYQASRGPDVFDMLLNLPYILVPPDERRAMFRELEERREAEQRRRVQEKVDAWNRQIIP